MLIDLDHIRGRIADLHGAWRALARPDEPTGAAQRLAAVRAQWEAWKAWRAARLADDALLATALPSLPDWAQRYETAYAAAAAAELEGNAPSPAQVARAQENAKPAPSWPEKLARDIAWGVGTALGVGAILAVLRLARGR